MKVEIQGHVCCTGSKADGLDTDTGYPNLSENRARAVYNFLIENGIDKSRLRYKGSGPQGQWYGPKTAKRQGRPTGA